MKKEVNIPDHIKDNLIYRKCNLCGDDNYKIIYNSKYESETKKDLIEKFKSSGDETLIDRVVQCNKCSLVYINPQLKSELIVEGYSEGSDETFVSQAKGREITFKKCLDKIKKYKKCGKILDLGAAGGSFLHVARKEGWDVEGIEPNKWLCDWCNKNYGFSIKQGTLEDYPFPDNTFDVITLWDVLEHVHDPKSILLECNRILKTDGIIVINYPDYGSWLAKILKNKWPFLLSVHLYYFTPKTIKRMLNKTNFRSFNMVPHFQTLSLGYLCLRMKAYSKVLHKISTKVVKISKMGSVQVPYWLGQTLVFAKKK
jgi:2-polyprenyl-3-methyl-5-hydroxy-6-metoxy-1,4-benzoquinol methylase